MALWNCLFYDLLLVVEHDDRTAVGPLAYAAVVLSAGLEGLAIALAGIMTSLASAASLPCSFHWPPRVRSRVTEWLRSIGEFGVPFAQLGVTQVETPLRVLGAYIGTSGVTFVTFCTRRVCCLRPRTRAWRAFAAMRCHRSYRDVRGMVCVAGALLRRAPTVPVVAIQGNITQSLKWQPGSLARAVSVYTAMTRDSDRPASTVYCVAGNSDRVERAGLNQNSQLLERFTDLAAQANATIVAGSIRVAQNQYFNASYLFTPAGVSGIYDKRQLVPFAEHFPGKQFLGGFLTSGRSTAISQGDGRRRLSYERRSYHWGTHLLGVGVR